jgi:hypothetical protein
MRQNFFTKEELMGMPLGKLQRLVLGDGIKSPDEEALVNEVMNSKRGFMPIQQNITLRKDIDIKDQVQEQEWEKELASRVLAMNTPKMEDVVVPQPEVKPEVAPEVAPEPIPAVVPEVTPEAEVVPKPKRHKKIKVK